MHEAGIVNNIIELIKESIPPGKIETIDAVEIRVGKMSNVLPEALEFCFRSFIENSPLNHIRLIIDEQKLNIYCRDCTAVSESEDFIFNCPDCGSGNIEIIEGDQLMISNLYLKSEGELL